MGEGPDLLLTAFVCANIHVHVRLGKNVHVHVWQSCVELEGYSITHFDHIAVFEVLNFR